MKRSYIKLLQTNIIEIIKIDEVLQQYALLSADIKDNKFADCERSHSKDEDRNNVA